MWATSVARGVRLTIDEQGDRLIEQRLGKSRIVLHTGSYGVFEVTGQCHASRFFFRLCLAALVVFPQGDRFIDVFLLALLATPRMGCCHRAEAIV